MSKPVSRFEQFLEKATEHYQKAISADNACRVGDCAGELIVKKAYTTKIFGGNKSYNEYYKR